MNLENNLYFLNELDVECKKHMLVFLLEHCHFFYEIDGVSAKYDYVLNYLPQNTIVYQYNSFESEAGLDFLEEEDDSVQSEVVNKHTYTLFIDFYLMESIEILFTHSEDIYQVACIAEGVKLCSEQLISHIHILDVEIDKLLLFQSSSELH